MQNKIAEYIAYLIGVLSAFWFKPKKAVKEHPHDPFDGGSFN